MNKEEKRTRKILLDPQWEAAFNSLSDTEAAECLRDIYAHYKEKEITSYSSDKIQFFLVGVVFPAMDADKAAYIEKCAFNRQAIMKRWEEQKKKPGSDTK